MRKIRDPQSEKPLPGFEVFHDEFLSSRRQEIRVLMSALAASDFKIIVEHAHRWKGFAAPYGFQELEKSAIRLETLALDSDFDQCKTLLEEIDAYLGY